MFERVTVLFPGNFSGEPQAEEIKKRVYFAYSKVAFTTWYGGDKIQMKLPISKDDQKQGDQLVFRKVKYFFSRNTRDLAQVGGHKPDALVWPGARSKPKSFVPLFKILSKAALNLRRLALDRYK